MRQVHTMLFSSLLLIGLTACDRNEGPAEQAGEQVDDMMQETQEQFNDAVDETGEAIEETGDEVRDHTSQ